MAFDEDDQEKVEAYIRRNPNCTKNSIYKAVDIDKEDLSRILHILTQSMVIVKNKDTDTYSSIDISSGDSNSGKKENESGRSTALSNAFALAAEAAKTSTVVSKPVMVASHTHKHIGAVVEHTTAPVDAKPVVSKPIKPMLANRGKIKRRSDKGLIAFYFFSRKDDNLYISSGIIRDRFYKLDSKKISNLLWILTRDGYIVASDSSTKGNHYKWSGEFSYPYPDVQDSDVDDLLHMLGAKTLTENNTQINIQKPIIPVRSNDEKLPDDVGGKVKESGSSDTEPNDKQKPLIVMAISMIDARISGLEKELGELNILREKYLNGEIK